ncbi:hypothetical protein [Streptomyces sp. NPDC054829]
MQDRTPNPASGRPDELRALLAAVLEALELPHPATVGDAETHDRILIERVRHAKIALQTVLVDRAPLGVEWTTAYLRERLAEHPPTGYVTYDQARTDRRTAEGLRRAATDGGEALTADTKRLAALEDELYEAQEELDELRARLWLLMNSDDMERTRRVLLASASKPEPTAPAL